MKAKKASKSCHCAVPGMCGIRSALKKMRKGGSYRMQKVLTAAGMAGRYKVRPPVMQTGQGLYAGRVPKGGNGLYAGRPG